MTTIGKRLSHVLENQGINAAKFCEKHGIDYAGFNKILNDRRELGMKVLQQIKQALPELDTEWLLFGNSRNSNFDEQTLENSTNDPGLKFILDCLEQPVIQKKIRNLVIGGIAQEKNDQLAQQEFDALMGTPGFIYQLEVFSKEQPKEFQAIMNKVEKWNKEDSKK